MDISDLVINLQDQPFLNGIRQLKVDLKSKFNSSNERINSYFTFDSGIFQSVSLDKVSNTCIQIGIKEKALITKPISDLEVGYSIVKQNSPTLFGRIRFTNLDYSFQVPSIAVDLDSYTCGPEEQPKKIRINVLGLLGLEGGKANLTSIGSGNTDFGESELQARNANSDFNLDFNSDFGRALNNIFDVVYAINWESKAWYEFKELQDKIPFTVELNGKTASNFIIIKKSNKK